MRARVIPNSDAQGVGYGWLEHTPNLTRGLIARGYSDTEVKKILGENWVKLFKRVWGK